jgi:hypothetical protein
MYKNGLNSLEKERSPKDVVLLSGDVALWQNEQS